MALLKCKMCGGDLQILPGVTVTECEYCGTRQTVPKVDDERKLTLFARAGRLRAACEFDKAAGIYEAIVADFPEEAEAYWGLVLCKYGIEYVDDPATGKKIPTCHRSSFESIMEDSDYEQAVENADGIARRVYREEAKAIEEIRKGIIAVSANEQPYDIFICYKETAENGERTLDSVLAQDVYDALTEKGYRVFFSRISLEDKLGQEYEPYIFAALHSAKIMLAFGTDYDYYNAVWVKNEWGRFLKLMAKDKSKHLIPCYKGIDAYDLPKEFVKLQAQDLGKVGATQDLLRGIEKLLPKAEQVAVVSAPVVQEVVPAGGVSITNLLKRAQIALEDEKWSAADEFCEQILNVDAENGEAYLYKFMAAKKIPDRCMIEERPELLFETEGVFKRDVARIRQYANSLLAQWLTIQENCWQLRQQEKLRYIREAEETRKRQQEQERSIAAQKAEAERQWKEKIAEDRREFQKVQRMLAAGFHWGVSACIKADGTVLVADKPKSKPYQATGWKDVVAICQDSFQLAGLCADGTVLTAPDKKVSFWKNIQEIATGAYAIAGLRTDGTVCTSDYDFDSAKQWHDITSISIGDKHMVGLKRNGTVVAAGNAKKGQCDVGRWNNIVAVSAGSGFTVGLQSNGKVVAVGDNLWKTCDVGSWYDVVAISAGVDHTLGLRVNGTVYITASNESLNKYNLAVVHTWKNIIAISAGYRCAMGLRADGTVLVAGEIKHGRANIEGQNLFDSLLPAERQAVLQKVVDGRNNYLKY